VWYSCVCLSHEIADHARGSFAGRLGSYDRSRQIGILGFTLEQGARGIPLADYIAAVAKQANRYSPELIPLSDFMKLLRGINIFP
jgi:hypothetical protein